MTDNYRKQTEVTPDGSFPLEKILTASARDYCKSVGKNLSDYEMRGVHGLIYMDINDSNIVNFTKNIPRHTEVIVDYKSHPRGGNSTYLIASGTALIPKTPTPNIG